MLVAFEPSFTSNVLKLVFACVVEVSTFLSRIYGVLIWLEAELKCF